MKSLDDVVFLLMCLVISFFGILIMFDRSYESYRFGLVDFGPYHDAVGFILMVFGVLAILYGTFYKGK